MYTTVKLKRGFTEISDLFEFCNSRGLKIFGGYARYCASPNNTTSKPSDIDIFAFNDNDYLLAKSDFLAESLSITKETTNTVAFNPSMNLEHRWASSPTIHLVKPIIHKYETIYDLLKYNDITVASGVILSPYEVLVNEYFEQDELLKNIRFTSITDPVSTLFRVYKYMARGYTLKSSESLRLFLDWENSDSEYKNNLILKWGNI
jgi:hypothetical protein